MVEEKEQQKLHLSARTGAALRRPHTQGFPYALMGFVYQHTPPALMPHTLALPFLCTGGARKGRSGQVKTLCLSEPRAGAAYGRCVLSAEQELCSQSPLGRVDHGGDYSRGNFQWLETKI